MIIAYHQKCRRWTRMTSRCMYSKIQTHYSNRNPMPCIYCDLHSRIWREQQCRSNWQRDCSKNKPLENSRTDCSCLERKICRRFINTNGILRWLRKKRLNRILKRYSFNQEKLPDNVGNQTNYWEYKYSQVNECSIIKE